MLSTLTNRYGKLNDGLALLFDRSFAAGRSRMNIEIEKIFSEAKRFREAIARCKPQLKAISLREFPSGSCGDASDLLGIYLQQSLGISAEYIAGWFNEGSHAWLEFEGLIIDITADQFHGCEPVIVTSSSELHSKFSRGTCRDSGMAGIGGCIGSHKADLLHDYQLILNHISTPE